MKNSNWKVVEDFPNYSVSRFGQIKNNKTNKILKPWMNNKGYLYISLGRQYRDGVHEIVARMFIPNPLLLKEINHLDGNKENNCIENLEWSTRSKNTQHAFDKGLNKVGSKHGRSKLSEKKVKEIKFLLKTKNGKKTPPLLKDIAFLYKVDRKTIESIFKNKTWRHVK